MLTVVDRDELETLDQCFELLVLLVGLGLLIAQYILDYVFPDLNTILNLLNITITAFIWVGYKIARIRQAVDLRILMIAVTIRFFGTLFILALSWVFYILPDASSSIIGYIQPLLFIIGLILFAGYGDYYAEKRVEKLYSDRQLANSPPELNSMKGRDAIYLVRLLKIDTFLPSMSIMFVLTMGLIGWSLSIATIVPLGFLLMVIYGIKMEYSKFKGIQRKIFTKAG